MTNDEWAMMTTICAGGGRLASARRRRIVKRQQIQYPLRKIACALSVLRDLLVGHKAVVKIGVQLAGFEKSILQSSVAGIVNNTVNQVIETGGLAYAPPAPAGVGPDGMGSCSSQDFAKQQPAPGSPPLVNVAQKAMGFPPVFLVVHNRAPASPQSRAYGG